MSEWRCGEPESVFIRAVVKWSIEMIGQGYIVPEEECFAYCEAVGDDADWETLHDRLLIRC